jgi:hypothetical protein
MRSRILSALKRLWGWLEYWFWKKPISKPTPLTAKEVIQNWTIVECKGQRIALHHHEIPMWNAMSRKNKRAMALRVKAQEEKGEIRFIEIDGRVTCIRNLDYDRRAEKKKQAEHGL